MPKNTQSILTRTSGLISSTGSGPDLVLLHGFGLNETIWSSVIPLLEPHFTVHVVGWPGLSERVPYLSLDSMEAAAEWLYGVLQPISTPVYLAGHSMGGYVALAFLKRYAARVKGLMLVHSHVFPDSKDKKLEREKAARFVVSYGTKKWLKEAIPPLFGSTYKKNNPELLTRWIDKLAYIQPEVIAGYLEAMTTRQRHMVSIKNAGFPLGVIAGEEDVHAPMEWQYHQLTMAPSATLYYLSESAHMGMLEAPEKTANAIIDYHNWCTMMKVYFAEE